MSDRQRFFESVYANNLWASHESRSGKGSELEATAPLRQELTAVLHYFGIRSMLDLPCGDFHWMQHVDLAGIRYIGADIVPDIVANNQQRFGNADRQFVHADLVSGPLPKADVVFCRDCMIHCTLELIQKSLQTLLTSGATYVFLTHDNSLIRYLAHANCNVDLEPLENGVNYLYRTVNFTLPPFSFPPPLHFINEGFWDHCKTMALWRTDTLRQLLYKPQLTTELPNPL